MKKYLFLIILLHISFSAFSQDTKTEILNRFFQMYKVNSMEAIDYMYGTNDWIDLQGEAVVNLKNQLSQLETMVGKYCGEEQVYEVDLGKSFTMYVYLAKYERQPLRFTFEFYKPQDKWMVYSFKFDDSFDDDMDNIIKYEYLSGKN